MRPCPRKGFTLMETLVAMMLFGMIALGSASLVVHASSTVLLQKNKRAALSAANARMERVHTADFERMEVRIFNNSLQSSTFFIDEVNNPVEMDPKEAVLVAGTSRGIKVEASLDLSNINGADDLGTMWLEIQVRVQYGPGDAQWVVLDSRIFSLELE